MKIRTVRVWFGMLYIVFLSTMLAVYPWEQSGQTEETAENEVVSWGERKKVALTFDDGPHPQTTEFLLDGLKERGIKASFFVIGKNAEAYPELVKREAQEGHLVGNHTYSHVKLTDITLEEACKEIEKTQKILEDITGKVPGFMRPPFGSWQKELEEKLGLMPVLWSVDSLDWVSENEGEIIERVVTDVEENDMILLHDCYMPSVRAALQIADRLTAEGFTFVTVEELLLD